MKGPGRLSAAKLELKVQLRVSLVDLPLSNPGGF